MSVWVVGKVSRGKQIAPIDLGEIGQQSLVLRAAHSQQAFEPRDRLLPLAPQHAPQMAPDPEVMAAERLFACAYSEVLQPAPEIGR
jgi:hypothetical protein